jgi:hypothetical protein
MPGCRRVVWRVDPGRHTGPVELWIDGDAPPLRRAVEGLHRHVTTAPGQTPRPAGRLTSSPVGRLTPWLKAHSPCTQLPSIHVVVLVRPWRRLDLETQTEENHRPVWLQLTGHRISEDQNAGGDVEAIPGVAREALGKAFPASGEAVQDLRKLKGLEVLARGLPVSSAFRTKEAVEIIVKVVAGSYVPDHRQEARARRRRSAASLRRATLSARSRIASSSPSKRPRTSSERAAGSTARS